MKKFSMIMDRKIRLIYQLFVGNMILFSFLQTLQLGFFKGHNGAHVEGREIVKIQFSPYLIIEFFSECRAEYLKLVKNKTSVFEHRDSSWKKTRAIDTDHSIPSSLTRRRRRCCQRTSRLGYLLHGPPGTGKSSLSLSIAGARDLDIYILNISSVDDSSLGELFTELPARCVILLEDIDAVDATQSRHVFDSCDQDGKVSLDNQDILPCLTNYVLGSLRSSSISSGLLAMVRVVAIAPGHFKRGQPRIQISSTFSLNVYIFALL